ncbi:MAG: MFS transporter [Chitinophagaceae bacterium]
MHATIDRKKLFIASRIALITTAMTFAFRASLEGVWGTEFQLNREQIGWIFSPAFWGFTLAMLFGGPLCDWIGMKRLLGLAFVGQLAGIILYLTGKDATTLFAGTVCIGIGNGMVEAACNPLVVSLYPEKKTVMLNRFHVWFPGGIVIGGLIGYFMISEYQVDWRIMIATLFIPLLIYGFLFWKLKFPPTERVSSGVSTQQMFRACLNPLFLVMLICMMLTAATELGTNQWLGALLQGAGISGILILVLINGIMALGRSFAGPVVHRLNPTGMLIGSMLLTAIGLVMMSKAEGSMAVVAAVIFAIGLCFVWPTMLGFVAEYLPRTGALGLSLTGGFGMLSVALIVPLMGRWYDGVKNVELAAGANEATANAIAGSDTFMKVAVMPAIVLVVMVVIYFARKKKVVESKGVFEVGQV